MKIDFGKAAEDYKKYRAGFPESFFSTLQNNALIKGNERVVDLGTGTGTVARGLANLGCNVIGIDPSTELLAEAKDLAEEAGLSVDWRKGSAETTELPNESVDIVTAGQCWHWLDHPKAMEEIKRILKPSGRLIIAHFDWLPIRANVVWHTEKLIKQCNPGWIFGDGIGIYPDWFRHLIEGEFTGIKSYSYDESVTYSHEGWRGRIRASAGVKGSLSPEKVVQFDQKHEKVLKENFPNDPLSIPHRIFVIQGTKASPAIDADITQ
jgi:SAM-dependent methyltransferase